MDSQLYVVINPDCLIGQTISKGLAQQGNSVVYLSENEQSGYAIAAEEPRVRFRHCSSRNLNVLEEELQWAQACISSINGIIIITSECEFISNDLPYSEDFFTHSCALHKNADKDIALTYVITPTDKGSNNVSFRNLHLTLCKQSHQHLDPAASVRTNYVMLPSTLETSNEICGLKYAEDTSRLIHQLTSASLSELDRQAFYFGN